MMNRRKAILLAAAAFPVAACSTTPTVVTTTIAQILADIQEQCQYVTSWQAIAQVITTLVANFNSAAGAAAQVVSTVATQVENMVCAAVMQAQTADEPRATAPATLTVVVNGVRVTGTIVPRS
jgi:hypothetical protein